MERSWVGKECGTDRRIGHGYDSALPLGPALKAKIGVMEQTRLKWGYGLMDVVIGEASGVRQLSVLLIVSETELFFYKRLAPTGVVPCSFLPTPTMSSLTLSYSPMPASRDVEELSKQLKITRKRQEAECTARLRCKEEKERCKCEEREQKECEEAAQKEAEVKAQCDQEEVEKRIHEEKGKEKMHGTSVGLGTLLTMFVQEVVILTSDNDMGSQQPKRKKWAGKKRPARLVLEPYHHCVDWGKACEEPPAGSKGTACKRCTWLHIMCKRAWGDKEEEEEEEVVVERITDNMKGVQDSRRAKVRPQAGMQTEEKETVEAGVEVDEGKEKGSEDGDKNIEGEKEMEE